MIHYSSGGKKAILNEANRPLSKRDVLSDPRNTSFPQQNKAPIEQDAPGPRVTGSGTVDDVLKSAASKTPEALMGRRNVGSGCSRTCDALIADIRRRTARERVRMMDLFEDFDRLGHGEARPPSITMVGTCIEKGNSKRHSNATSSLQQHLFGNGGARCFTTLME